MRRPRGRGGRRSGYQWRRFTGGLDTTHSGSGSGCTKKHTCSLNGPCLQRHCVWDTSATDNVSLEYKSAGSTNTSCQHTEGPPVPPCPSWPLSPARPPPLPYVCRRIGRCRRGCLRVSNEDIDPPVSTFSLRCRHEATLQNEAPRNLAEYPGTEHIDLPWTRFSWTKFSVVDGEYSGDVRTVQNASCHYSCVAFTCRGPFESPHGNVPPSMVSISLLLRHAYHTSYARIPFANAILFGDRVWFRRHL